MERIMSIMKKIVMAMLTVGLAFSAQAADKVTIQLKWVTQAQFGGYFVAQDKGYYLSLIHISAPTRPY